MRAVAAFALAALLGPKPAAAFFDGARQDLLSAASAGRGGVEAPAEPSVEALFDNPASLPRGAPWQAYAGYGSGSAAQTPLGLAMTYGPGLRLGALYNSLRDGRTGGGSYAEQAGALVLALDPNREQSLGLRLNALSLQAEAGPQVQGYALDLGWRWMRALPGFGTFTLGLAADHVAGAWPDEDWARAVPSDFRAGLGWRLRETLWVGLEERWREDAAASGGGGRELRLGAEWAPWRPGWLLRAGWHEDKGGESSLGLGLPLVLGLRLDYAALISGRDGSPRHRLALAWALQRPQDQLLSVVPTQVLTDPETGHVERASFRVALGPELGARRWRLELRDSEERLLRTLGPFDPAEAGADWDGRDEQGEPVAEGHRVGYTLVVDSPRGELRKSSVLDLAQAFESKPAVNVVGGLTPPRLKPVLAPDGTGLQQVAMELPDEGEAASWMLQLRGSGGQPLRKFSGLGRPPKELVWDGRDQQGVPVADPLGVAVDFQLRDQEGVVRSAEQPLFNQEAFALAQKEAKALPQLSLAPLGLPLISGRASLEPSAGALGPLLASAQRTQSTLAQALELRRDEALRRAYVQPQPGGGLDLDLFDRNESEPRPDRLPLLQALPVAKGAALLQLQGLTREDEPAGQALGRQRAFAAAQHLQARLSQGQAFLLSESPAPGPRLGLRALPRRAEAPQGWERLSARRRVEALSAAAATHLRARYDMAEEGGDPDELADRPLGDDTRQQLLSRWGIEPRGVITQWHAGTGKALLFKAGCLWVTDAEGKSLRSLWYDPDLNAAGQIRFSEDGSRLWLRADGWRRWVSLRLEVETPGEQALGK